MKCNKILLLIFCFAILFSSPVSAAPISDADAKAWVNDKGNRLLLAFSEDDLAKKYATLDDMFLNYVDLDYISRFVIGKYWRQMTPAQQSKYTSLFKRYALATYKGFPLNFKDRVNFAITNAYNRDKYKEVVVTVKVKEAPPEMENILVTFRLDSSKGQIKIVDIKLLETSLILSYRSQFYQMIANDDEDMEWFLEDFELSTTSTETANKLRLQQSQE